MPIYIPSGTNDQTRHAAGDLAKTSASPRGFETALPSEYALSNMGIHSESSQGVRSYQAGSIFDTAQNEFIVLQNVPVIDHGLVTYIDQPAVDLASGSAQQIVSLSGASLLEANTPTSNVYFPAQTSSESASSLDKTKASDAAQDSSTAANLDAGQESAVGGEVKDAKKEETASEGAQLYTPAVDDGVQEQQTYAHPEWQDPNLYNGQSDWVPE